MRNTIALLAPSRSQSWFITAMFLGDREDHMICMYSSTRRGSPLLGVTDTKLAGHW
jgi:hypothetical protein